MKREVCQRLTFKENISIPKPYGPDTVYTCIYTSIRNRTDKMNSELKKSSDSFEHLSSYFEKMNFHYFLDFEVYFK